MRMLGDLPDQSLAIACGHPVLRLDLLIRVDALLKARLERSRVRRGAAVPARGVQALGIHAANVTHKSVRLNLFCVTMSDTHERCPDSRRASFAAAPSRPAAAARRLTHHHALRRCD